MLPLEKKGWTKDVIIARWKKYARKVDRDKFITVHFVFSKESDAEKAQKECSSFGWKTTLVRGEKHFRFSAMVPVSTRGGEFNCWFNSCEGAWYSVAERHSGKFTGYDIYWDRG